MGLPVVQADCGDRGSEGKEKRGLELSSAVVGLSLPRWPLFFGCCCCCLLLMLLMLLLLLLPLSTIVTAAHLSLPWRMHVNLPIRAGCPRS
jgi:hypothetical protein